MPNPTDEIRPTKMRNWPLIIVITITVIVVVIALGAKSGLSYLKAVQRTKMPFYSLEIQGEQLVFRTDQTGKAVIFKTIATLPKSDVSVSLNSRKLVIQASGKTFTRNSVEQDGLVISPKNRAVFFHQAIPNPSAGPNKPNTVKYLLWRWDEKAGFTKVMAPLSHIMTTQLSLDENTLMATYHDDDLRPKFGVVTYTVPIQKGILGSPNTASETAVLIDADNVILGNPGLNRDGKYVVTYRGFKLSSKTYFPFYIDPTVKQVIGFNGSVWCRAESPGKQSILRLNKTFDKVEERIDFPAINPEP